jgi:hypothetical protein
MLSLSKHEERLMQQIQAARRPISRPLRGSGVDRP